MKKRRINVIYLFYVLLIIALTYFLSLKILEKNNLTGFTTLVDESETPEHPYHCINDLEEPVPNCETIFDGIVVKLPITYIQTNSDGFRDFEYSTEKPSNTFRIIVLGDSISWGHGVEMEDTYPKILERMLNIRNEETSYEVLNLGISGYNTFEEVEVFKEYGVKFHPDLLVLQYSPDDIYNRTRTREIYEDILSNYIKEGKVVNRSEISDSVNHQLHVKAYDNHQKELDGLMKKDFDNVWDGVGNYLFELNTITDKLNVDVSILIVYPQPEDHKNELNKLEEIVDNYNWYMIRVDDIFNEYEWSTLTLHPKDSHPNALANTLIAKKIYNDFVDYGLI